MGHTKVLMIQCVSVRNMHANSNPAPMGCYFLAVQSSGTLTFLRSFIDMVICTVEKTHNSKKRLSFRKENCSLELEFINNELHMIIDNRKININQKIKLYQIENGFSFRSTNAEALFRFITETESLAGIYEQLQNFSKIYQKPTVLETIRPTVILNPENHPAVSPYHRYTPYEAAKPVLVTQKSATPHRPATHVSMPNNHWSRQSPVFKSSNLTSMRRATTHTPTGLLKENHNINMTKSTEKGFRNHGQTCYIAAVLQLILDSQMLKRTIPFKNQLKQISCRDTTLYAFIKLYQLKIAGMELDIGPVKNKIASTHKLFNNNEQQVFVE